MHNVPHGKEAAVYNCVSEGRAVSPGMHLHGFRVALSVLLLGVALCFLLSPQSLGLPEG